MKVEEYRDLISRVARMATDFQACVNDAERLLWAKRAEKIKLESWCAEGTCGRATKRDHAKMQAARDRLAAAFQATIHLLVEA